MFFETSFDVFSSLIVIFFVITIAVNFILAILVLSQDRRSAANIAYFFVSVTMTLWLIFTFGNGLPMLQDHLLLVHRLGIFAAAPLSTSFFILAHTLPHKKLQLSKTWLIVILGLTALMMVLNLSPYAFTGLQPGSTNPTVGWGFMPFATISTVFSVMAIFLLIRKYFRSQGDEKKQLQLTLVGIFIMLLLIIATVLIPILFFNSIGLVALTPLYSLIFLSLTAYAITKYHLFEVKLLIAQAVTAVIAIVLFAKVVSSDSFENLVVDALIFLVFLYFGIQLIRNVKREIKQRQQIEQLAERLEKANERLKELDKMKSEFVSIASHQLRSPLTTIRGYASMLLEGTYGELSEKAKEAIKQIGDSSRYMALSVEDYLNVSRIEAGNMKYELSEFNLKEETDKIVEELQPAAQKKKLELISKEDCKGTCVVNADLGKTRQIIQNIIDNAMKYTPKGAITVTTHDDIQKSKIYVTVKDTGVGMDKETLEGLFGKFNRARNANKVNVTGTGLGLFVAKKMAEDMHGRIWAESEGEGKGSTFHIELPLTG